MDTGVPTKVGKETWVDNDIRIITNRAGQIKIRRVSMLNVLVPPKCSSIREGKKYV